MQVDPVQQRTGNAAAIALDGIAAAAAATAAVAGPTGRVPIT